MKRDWAKATIAAQQSLSRAHERRQRRLTVPLAALGGDCPKCGAATKARVARLTGDTFFGCTRYPRCTGVWKPPRPG